MATFKKFEIGNLVERAETWKPSTRPNTEFIYIDLSSIDKESQAITNAVATLGIDAPSRARQLVAYQDILVSTVRPNLNGVAAVSSELDGATASTGYCVLRPIKNKLCWRYLYHWVRSPGFVRDMSRKATGASYPAVPDRIIRESKIPLPILEEQKRIAAILDKADTIRRQRQDAIELTNDFVLSLFVDMFGDPNSNPNGWDTKSISEFVESFEGGKNIATDDAPSVNTKHFILKVSAVTWGEFKPEESKPVPPDFKPPDSYLVRKGDLLFSRANTTQLVGATVYVYETPENLILPDKLWRVNLSNPRTANHLYLRYAFGHPAIQAEIGKRATGTSGSMKNISKAKLMSMKMPLPPVKLQDEFAEIVLRHREHCLNQQAALQESNDLFSSLVQRAFKGEL